MGINLNKAFSASYEEAQLRLTGILEPLYSSPQQALQRLLKIMMGERLDILNGSHADIVAAKAFAKRMQIAGCMTQSEISKAQEGGLMGERAYKEARVMIAQRVKRLYPSVVVDSGEYYAHIALMVLKSDVMRHALGAVTGESTDENWREFLTKVSHDGNAVFESLVDAAEAYISLKKEKVKSQSESAGLTDDHTAYNTSLKYTN